jgi:chemotaxis protein CheC
LGVTGDINGNILFVLDLISARRLVNILMGNPVNQEITFDSMECSALQEIGNILAGSYLSSLSNLTNLKILSDIPGLAIDMAGAILSVPAIEFGKSSDTALYIENEFLYGSDSVIGDFFLVPDEASYIRLLKALGVA